MVENSRTGSSENIQSDTELSVEEGSNKRGEQLNAKTIGMENALQTDTAVTPNGKSISNESCPNSN